LTEDNLLIDTENGNNLCSCMEGYNLNDVSKVCSKCEVQGCAECVDIYAED